MFYDEDAEYEFMARYDDQHERYAATIEDARRMAEDDERAAREEAAAAVAALGFTAQPILLIPEPEPEYDPDDDLPF